MKKLFDILIHIALAVHFSAPSTFADNSPSNKDISDIFNRVLLADKRGFSRLDISDIIGVSKRISGKTRRTLVLIEAEVFARRCSTVSKVQFPYKGVDEAYFVTAFFAVIERSGKFRLATSPKPQLTWSLIETKSKKL